jgi:hypothetical protein
MSYNNVSYRLGVLYFFSQTASFRFFIMMQNMAAFVKGFCQGLFQVVVLVANRMHFDLDRLRRA